MKAYSNLLALLLFSSSILFSQNTIRITNGEWEPYLSEHSYEYGLASHIVAEAFKIEGIDIEWGFFPWIRSYNVAKSGEWDASAVWWPTEGSNEFFLISDPVINTSYVFFYLKENIFAWDNFEDLVGKKIGLTRGYDYGQEFNNEMKKGTFNTYEASRDEMLYKLLLSGRIDIFPNDPIVGNAQIRNSLNADQIPLLTNHPKEFEKSTLHLIISKKSKKAEYFLDKFNSGLKKIKENGTLDKMFLDLEKGLYDIILK